MPKTGVEPATYALRVRCSANWAISASYINNYTSVAWNCKDIKMNLYRRNPTWLRFLRKWKKFLKNESYRLKLIISYDKLISLLSERSLIKQFQKTLKKLHEICWQWKCPVIGYRSCWKTTIDLWKLNKEDEPNV